MICRAASGVQMETLKHVWVLSYSYLRYKNRHVARSVNDLNCKDLTIDFYITYYFLSRLTFVATFRNRLRNNRETKHLYKNDGKSF